MKLTRRPGKIYRLLALFLVLGLLASACGAGTGAPTTPGQYPVQKDSVHFDGQNYQLYWADNAQNGTLHHMQTRNLRMVRDPNGTFLEVPQGGGDSVLHLREDEPITVDGRDNQGAFSSPWFPFLLGATVGNVLGGGGFGGRGGQTIIINNPAPGETRTYDASTPAYRYPPTGSFGRDDELHGTLDTSKPQPPDYSKVQPAPYATAGKSAGTGGGTAASSKSVGGGAAGASNATSGQVGGTGSGSAASSKGGFADGSQSYSGSSSGGSGTGAGSSGSLGSGSSSTSGGSGLSKPSTGGGGASTGGGSKGIGGARAPSVGGRR